MEISKLEGNLIGICGISKNEVILDDNVNKLIVKKVDKILLMLKLDNNILNKKYSELSIQEQKKINLGMQINKDIIVLKNFFVYFNIKDIMYFKKLLSQLVKHNKKIIIIEPNITNFINFVDIIYTKNESVQKYNDFYDNGLYVNIDKPEIVQFVEKIKKRNIKMDNYLDINELIKAIYRSLKW